MNSHESSHQSDLSIAKLKNEAKQLKKQSNLSLMQAQTMIAKKNGYNNWHDFLQKLKNIWRSEPKFNDYIQPEEVTSKSINKTPKDGLFHIGREMKSKLEYWLSWNKSRCHMHIFEEYSSIYSMDMYIAKQAIMNDNPVVFTSTDIDSTKVLINLALSNNRKKIYLFDPMGQIVDFNEYKKHKLSIPTYNMGALSSFLYAYNVNELLSDVYKNEFMHFLQLVSAITIYQKEHEQMNISLNIMVENGNINQFKKYENIFNDAHPMKKYLKEWINLPSKDKEKIIIFENNYIEIIEKLKATNMFNHDSDYVEVNFDGLYDEDNEYPIFIFLSNKSQLLPKISSQELRDYSQLINLTVINYYGKFLSDVLGGHHENKNNDRKRVDEDCITFVMRNLLVDGFVYGNMPSHQRAIGGSFVFTFNHLPSEHSMQLKALLANASTYFFGKFTKKITLDYPIRNMFDQMLSSYLMSKVYATEKLNYEYAFKDIGNLDLNEYIVFNKGKLLKITI